MIRTLVCLALLVETVLAQDFEFYPGAKYNSSIPTLQQTIGHNWGEAITSHAQVERYLQTLDEASPIAQVVPFGRSWEERSLYYLIIASEETHNRLEEIKAGIQKLADPRKITNAEADNLIKSLPTIVWLSYSVHGDEISSTEAALLVAYHLLASENDSLVAAILKNCVVIIDPLQNPDGRDRFIHYYRQTVGRWPDPDPQAAEHNEAWPSGRMNHYLFDMNRDWFALTQPETRARVWAFLDWYPQVFVDLHEMGADATYYFPPTAPPWNPDLTPGQIQWLARFGKNNARWFDRLRFDYFTGEVFDSFYPGYGEGWPMFHGAIGMTYEQASTSGLLIRREDETTLHYREAVQHHFISSISTLEVAAGQREILLRNFYDYRRSAIQEGGQEVVKEFILPPGRDRNRTQKLVSLLLQQGVEVKKAEGAFANARVKSYFDERSQSKNFPAGTYVISMAQPAKRLVKTLLAKHTAMESSFLQEQLRRYQKRIPDQIYDVTGWSLPLLFEVETFAAESVSSGKFVILTQPETPAGEIVAGPATLAYLISWNSNTAARALAELFRQEIRVFNSDKGLTLNGEKFPSGSLIIKVKDNPPDLHQRLQKIAEATGVTITATNTAWVEDGVNFGSNEVVFLKRPKVAMAYDLPTHPYSTGWTRFVLEQQFGYPVTIIPTRQLGTADLNKYNVLIFPNSLRFFGDYGQTIGEAGVDRLKGWLQNGGTLITFGEASRWLLGEKVKLLETTLEYRGGKRQEPKREEKSEKASAAETKSVVQPVEPFDYETAILPEEEMPGGTPGAIMRITLDTEHWLAFGYDGNANVLVESRNIFTPIKLDKGRNIGVFMKESEVLLSGFTWEDAQKQIAGKAYLMHQPHGQGHVVAFAEDPNYRAYMDGLNLLFMNAVFFGPAH